MINKYLKQNRPNKTNKLKNPTTTKKQNPNYNNKKLPKNPQKIPKRTKPKQSQLQMHLLSSKICYSDVL